MPTYQYECFDCHETFEVVQKISEDPIKVCGKCGSSNVKRLISATSFVLKGSGWYKTDYAAKGSASSSSSSSSTSNSDATVSTPSTDASTKSGDSTTSNASGSSAGSTGSASSTTSSSGSKDS